MNNQKCGINQTLQGFYKIAIVDGTTGEVKWQQEEWGKNLILNQGMDNINVSSVVDQMTYGIAGTGTRPNSSDGGTSTITQSGAGVYLFNRSGDIIDFTSSFNIYPALVQIGDVLQYVNGSQSMVTSVTDGFNLQVTPSYTITSGDAQTFAVWKTSQVGLQTELKRTNTYLGGSTNCGTTIVSNVATHRRTFDFTAEVGSVGYNEIGIGWAVSGANTVFSRILLPSTITIDTGFQLRIIYDLQTTWTPVAEQYKTGISIGGWPVSPSTNVYGSESIQSFLISTVNVSDGASINTTAMLDPYFTTDGSNILSLWASPQSSSLAAFGSAINRSVNAGYTTTAMTKASYVANSYLIDKTGILLIGDIPRTDIRSVGLGRYNAGLGYNPAAAAYQVICYLFNQNQSKNSSQTLSFTYRWLWSRILS